MKISYNLLKNFFSDLPDPKELSDILTDLGHEVESIEYLSNDKVVIGRLESVEQHPNADRLTLCKVNVGEETLQIVCGATNHKEGDLVPVALVGANILGFEIKRSKLRGSMSEGMLCAPQELGFKASDGILILNSGREGENFFKHFTNNDVIFDLSITPNRPDVLSHLGLAREITVHYNKTLYKDSETLKENKVFDEEVCSLYLAHKIEGIEIKLSDEKSRSALLSLNTKSVNNLVDISNLVMFELGHPNHIFDADKIEGDIRVERAKDNSIFLGLDGEEYKLTSDDIVVVDDKKILALAGIMGGANSAVDENTKNIIIEVAGFNKKMVRKSSKRLALMTEASYRFERGVDIEDAKDVMERIEALIGKKGSHYLSHYVANIKKEVSFDVDKMNAFLGTDISNERAKEILTNLGFRFSGNIVSVPSFRSDISIAEDLYEEVLRVYGYSNVKSKLPYLQPDISPSEEFEKEHIIRDLLPEAGFSEVVAYSFVPKGHGDKEISNPITEDFAVMRSNTIYSMLKIVEYNLNNFMKKVSIFEIGKVYPSEKKVVSAAISGTFEKSIYSKKRDADFYDLKVVLDILLHTYDLRSSTLETLHPGRSADIYVGDSKVGFIGEVLDSGLKRRVYVTEIDFDAVSFDKKIDTTKVSKYPAVERDLSLLFDIKTDKLQRVINEICSNNLIKESKIVDIYNMPDKRSVSFRFRIQDSNKTLEEQEINSVVNDVLKKAEKYGAYLREE